MGGNIGCGPRFEKSTGVSAAGLSYCRQDRIRDAPELKNVDVDNFYSP